MSNGLHFSPPDQFAQDHLTRMCFLNWTGVHDVLLKGWVFHQLLRVKTFPAFGQLARSDVVAKFRKNKDKWRSTFEVELAQMKFLLSPGPVTPSSSSQTKSKRAKVSKDKPYLPDGSKLVFRRLADVVFGQSVEVLWPKKLTHGFIIHHVSCAVCNRFPVPDRVFECSVCEDYHACIDCFCFHDSTHLLTIIGNDPLRFPKPEDHETAPVGPNPPSPVAIEDFDEWSIEELNVILPKAPEGVNVAATEKLEEWTIIAFKEGRTYREQEQYLITWCNAKGDFQYDCWVTKQQLTQKGDDGEAGLWKLKAPYDIVDNLVAKLAEIPTPLFATKKEKKKKPTQQPNTPAKEL